MPILIDSHAAAHPDAPALVDERGVTTWADFGTRVAKLCNGLRAAGLEAGDTLVVLMGNRREFFEVFGAAANGGWVVVPVNWHWVAEELAYVSANAGAKVVLVDDRFLDVAVEARADDRAGGVLAWVVGSEGMNVSRGEEVARIADLSAFRVEATVSDVHAARISAGLPALIVSGEERELGFGRDDAVKVTRVELQRAKGETGIIRTSSTDEQHLKITVRNLHDWTVPVTVIDQVPVSEHEKIEIEILPMTTEPSESNYEEKQGVLAWTFDLKPQEQNEIALSYEIRWPAKREIIVGE